MNIRTVVIISSSICIMTAWAGLFGTSTPPLEPKPVLTADTNHDNALSTTTVKAGQDLILIRPNPAKLSKDAVVFQTKNYNLYTSASWEDLQNPEMVKKLLFGKVMKDGTIKVYTLPNLGYAAVQPTQNPDGSTTIYLVNNKGATNKVTQINFKPQTFHLYDPTTDKTKSS